MARLPQMLIVHQRLRRPGCALSAVPMFSRRIRSLRHPDEAKPSVTDRPVAPADRDVAGLSPAAGR